MNHLSHAVLSQSRRGRWYVWLVTAYGGVFQLLEEYEGEDGKAYWLERLNALGCEIKIEE
jgi:hypothetical protein